MPTVKSTVNNVLNRLKDLKEFWNQKVEMSDSIWKNNIDTKTQTKFPKCDINLTSMFKMIILISSIQDLEHSTNILEGSRIPESESKWNCTLFVSNIPLCVVLFP